MIKIEFPAKWIDENEFEQTLRTCHSPHKSQSPEVHFKFPVDCKIMVGAATRLLSLINQLNYCSGKHIRLIFEGGESGTMGYLDRMRFFKYLAPEISVEPHPPVTSSGDIFKGNNQNLVEINSINSDLSP